MKKHTIIFYMCLLSSLVSAQEIISEANKYDSLINVGYNQEASLSKSPYSASTIYVNDLEHSPEVDIQKSLYGKIPGLYIYQGQGIPAENYATMHLRGRAPLILVDGVPRDLNALTMTEIESVTVLTDAASAALYGVRGGNGVVSITTKKAEQGPMQISVNYQFGFNTKFRAPDFADAYTYANSLNTAYRLDGFSERYTPGEVEAFRTGAFPLSYPNVDWQRQVYYDYGYNNQFDVLVKGGADRFRYLTAIVYSYDKAMFSHTKDDSRYSTKPFDVRLNLRANVEVDLTSTTLFNVNLMGRLNEVNTARRVNDLISSVYNTPSAAFPVRTQDGIFGGNNIYNDKNPVALAGSDGHSKNTYSTLYADMKIKQDLSMLTKGLYASLSIALDTKGVTIEQTSKTYRYRDMNPTMQEDGSVIVDPIIYGTDSEVLSHVNGSLQSLYVNTNFQAHVGYDRTFNDHKVSGLLVYDGQSNVIKGQNMSMKRQSFIGSAAYTYRDRYMLNGVLSYSGTAVLPKNDWYNTYPAVSAAWIASNEDFMKKVSFVDFLRVKASYGLSGWDANTPHDLDIQTYEWAPGYFFGENVSSHEGYHEGALPVENLAIEKSEKVTVGLDGAMFNNRFNFSLEGFYDRRSNMLVNSSNSVSGIIGVDVGLLSAGVVDYKGLDFSLSWKDKVKDFNYGLSGTFSFTRTKVININEAYQEHDYLYKKGNSLYQSYGLECIGFFKDQVDINNSPVQSMSIPRPGDMKYKDQNGDNIIDEKDMVKMYRPSMPEVYYGFSINVGWKNLQLIADFQGVTNRTVSLLNSPLYKPLVNNGNISNTFLDRETPWSPENSAAATMPRLTSQENYNNYQYNSSLWYRNGSFLKLRNIELSYLIPRKVTNISDIKVYIRGTNLFSIDGVKFADPEQLGISYPSLRAYWAGIKLQF